MPSDNSDAEAEAEDDVDVVDDRAALRFVAALEGQQAELDYRVDGDRLVLVHTEVPDALSGHGLGGHLVEAAVTRARGSGETIVPTCSFARKWLEQHAEAVEGVSIDWS